MQDQFIILAPIMLQIIGLTLAIIIDPYIKKQDRKNADHHRSGIYSDGSECY